MACLYFHQFQAVCESFMEMDEIQINVISKYRGVKKGVGDFSNLPNVS